MFGSFNMSIVSFSPEPSHYRKHIHVSLICYQQDVLIIRLFYIPPDCCSNWCDWFGVGHRFLCVLLPLWQVSHSEFYFLRQRRFSKRAIFQCCTQAQPIDHTLRHLCGCFFMMLCRTKRFCKWWNSWKVLNSCPSNPDHCKDKLFTKQVNPEVKSCQELSKGRDFQTLDFQAQLTIANKKKKKKNALQKQNSRETTDFKLDYAGTFLIHLIIDTFTR